MLCKGAFIEKVTAFMKYIMIYIIQRWFCHFSNFFVLEYALSELLQWIIWLKLKWNFYLSYLICCLVSIHSVVLKRHKIVLILCDGNGLCLFPCLNSMYIIVHSLRLLKSNSKDISHKISLITYTMWLKALKIK